MSLPTATLSSASPSERAQGRTAPPFADAFTTEAIRLESLLAEHGIAARVGQVALSEQAVRFPLQLGLGTTTQRLQELSRELADGASYPGCRLRREGHLLYLELPRDSGVGLRYGDLLARMQEVPRDGALLGVMANGTPLVLRLPLPSIQHVLVTGDAGLGKTELLRLLALGMAVHHSARHWRLALLGCRPGPGLTALRALPHCWAQTDQTELAMGYLVRLWVELKVREREQRPAPRVLIVVDDADRLIHAGGGVMIGVLQALLERGGAVGLHLALACRSEWSVEPLCPLFPVRLQSDLHQIPGCFLMHHEEEALPLTTARLDPEEVRGVVARIRWDRPRLLALPTLGAATLEQAPTPVVG